MKDAYSPEELSILNDLAGAVARNADRKGFRDAMKNLMTPEQWAGELGALLRAAIYTSNIHGESSEFWEAFRNGSLDKPCDKAAKMEALGLPPLTDAEEEIADMFIRTLDQAQAHGVDVAKAVSVKMQFNRSRPILHGGKRALATKMDYSGGCQSPPRRPKPWLRVGLGSKPIRISSPRGSSVATDAKR